MTWWRRFAFSLRKRYESVLLCILMIGLFAILFHPLGPKRIEEQETQVYSRENLGQDTFPKRKECFGTILRSPSIEVFRLPHSKGTLAKFEPLCFSEGSWIIIEDAAVDLIGFSSISQRERKNALETILNESKLTKFTFRSALWLQKQTQRSSVQWIMKDIAIQVFDRSCTNIAHFAGRLMLYFHFLQHYETYRMQWPFTTVFIRVPELVRNLLTKSYTSHRLWQKRLVAAVLYKHEVQDNFFEYPSNHILDLEHFQKSSGAGRFYIEDSLHPVYKANDTICFHHGMLLGLLKGVFFSPTVEDTYLSKRKETRDGLFPIIPEDAIRFRKNWYSSMHIPFPNELKHTVIYLKREGNRRAFSHTSEIRVDSLLRNETKKQKYHYQVLKPEQLGVLENLKVFSSAAIVISLHGAHLTNAIFMAPCSVLIEIFPPKFTHDMYREGGKGGIKYFSWQLQTGQAFTEKTCQNLDECRVQQEKKKVFYRDQANLTIGEEDFEGLKSKIHATVF
eukprot:jgi/Galph1/972/GphlegSOOS_G5708.1